jgi:ferredoxin
VRGIAGRSVNTAGLSSNSIVRAANDHCRRRLERRNASMTHVVAEPCFGCKYTDCVVVCPVECFYEGEKMLYIHPDECIDCEACVPECPVEAIFHEDNLPEEWKEFTALNAEMALQTPVITEKKEPLAGA